jgi:N utilization substance protein B
MPRVDRCIMAVALYEMFFVDDIPVSVSINEAVELSKVYGTDDSFSFVNGILGRVARLADENPGVPMAELARQVAEQAQAAQAPGDEVAAGQAAEGEPAAAEKTAEGEDEPAQADPEPAVQPDPEPAARDDEQAADDPA